MEDIEAELEAKSIEREQTNLEIKEVVSEAAQPDNQLREKLRLKLMKWNHLRLQR